MATIRDIDEDRTFCFYGNVIEISNDPELIMLANESKIPNMLCVSNTITKEIVIEPADTQVLFEFLYNSSWYKKFNENIQSLSCTEDDDLLTGWLTLDEFNSLLSSPSEHTKVNQLLTKLAGLTQNWKELGVEEVMFDGFERRTSANIFF